MSFVVNEEDYLAHYGILRKSGRYPWGSGGPEYASNKGFLDMVNDMKRQGMTDVEIAKGVGISTTQLRAAKSIAKSEEKAAQISTAQRLRDKGMGASAIGKQMGIPESSVRSLLAPGAADKSQVLDSTAEFLRTQIEQKQYLDVGTGTEYYVGTGVSRGKMDNAIAKLKEEGYELIPMQIDQQGTGNKTNLKVLAPPGTTYKDIASDKSKIQTITGYSEDGGRHFTGILPPMSIPTKRVGINYAEDGGGDADGVIYVRPGVKDVSLGGKNYAQVRIAVNNTHYLKGMAMYKDDLPEGVDLVFNTNKSKAKIGDNPLDAMKPMQKDPFNPEKIDLANPFGSTIKRQVGDIDLDTGRVKKLTSAMNIVNEQGDWDRWSRNLSSQMLSKQEPKLAKQQLDVVLENKKADLDEIMQLTNPAVKKKLLGTFADGADSSSVMLKAAALPRTQSHVILPMDALKPSEVYAPNYNNGERVALVRYPHGGKFEIPELVVNNRNPTAKKALGLAEDAIGIHPDVAKRLSGADFDGDSVLVIPNTKGHVKSEPALTKLKDFDPQATYPGYPGMKKMTEHGKGTQMGMVSNLITDMTIRGASNEELARAVRHSMVVIDAAKHGLNYRQSAKDNGITQLMKKYQRGSQGGASTLISQRKGRVDVLARKNTPIIDRDTGKLIWRETGESWVDKRTGERIFKTQKSQALKEAEDAFSLSSGTKMEAVYARHSNDLKAMANKARYEMVRVPPIQRQASAEKTYSQEVESLNAKLALAMRNRPRERQAQILANAKVQAVKDAMPDMDDAQEKKLRGQALAEARYRAGTDKSTIVITPREWQAIQAGALSNNKVSDILDNADIDKVRELAMPRTPRGMTAAKESRARSMLNLGYTQAEIAEQLGVSVSTVKSIL
jgi:hypothetical protein